MSDFRLSVRKDYYQKLFDGCKVSKEWSSKIEEAIALIVSNRSRYVAVETSTTVPWWFVGILHYRESTCDFNTHLHNGDPLTHQTIHVPPGRPASPPRNGKTYTWEESAEDALIWKTFDSVKDTSLPAWLWRFELWNGFGYAMRGLNSEYLWSGSNHFGSPPHCGKFTFDGHFDKNARSEQVGCAVILWEMQSRQLLESDRPIEPHPTLELTRQILSSPRSSVTQEQMEELKGGKCDIKVVRDTYFVQSPMPHPLLPDDRKIPMPVGSVLPVLAWRSLPNNYLVVTLDNLTFKGYNTWHCSLDEVRMRIKKTAPVPPPPVIPPVAQYSAPRAIVPGDLSTLPGDKVIRFMRSRGFRVRALNLVYIVGASADDWSPVPNTMDLWNDVRCIIRDSGEVLGSWKATTDPGHYYEMNPLNPAGCAILALGQHQDGWQLGLHHGHPALTQCGNIAIYRDRAMDGVRSGHTVIAGPECGINHHGTSGRDGDPNSIGRWSAGCCVGLYWKSHLQFVQFCRDSGNRTFDATLLDSVALRDEV